MVDFGLFFAHGFRRNLWLVTTKTDLKAVYSFVILVVMGAVVYINWCYTCVIDEWRNTGLL